MMENGKEYTFDKRTTEENKKFIDLLTTANDKLSQAVNNITYTLFPTINKDTIEELRNIIGNISSIEYNISADHISLVKPVEVVDKTKYYQLNYFHGRKDTGSIYVKTELNKKDYIDDDAFLLVLVNRGELDASEYNSITEIHEIDKKAYCILTDITKLL